MSFLSHHLPVGVPDATILGKAGVTCIHSREFGGDRYWAPAWAAAILLAARELHLPDDRTVAHLVRVKQDPTLFTVGRAVLAFSAHDPELARSEMLGWARTLFEGGVPS